MKKHFLSALILVISWAATMRTFSNDFFDGAEMGLALTENSEFEDFSCSLPEPTQVVKNYLEMIDPLRDLLNTTAEKGRETHPLSDILGTWTATIE